jgi:sulfur carrier protein ThiS
MALKISFTSVKPKMEPTTPIKGRYLLTIEGGATVGSVLERFGLGTEGMIALKNGIHADLNDAVNNGDTIDYLLVVPGG